MRLFISVCSPKLRFELFNVKMSHIHNVSVPVLQFTALLALLRLLLSSYLVCLETALGEPNESFRVASTYLPLNNVCRALFVPAQRLPHKQWKDSSLMDSKQTKC